MLSAEHLSDLLHINRFVEVFLIMSLLAFVTESRHFKGSTRANTLSVLFYFFQILIHSINRVFQHSGRLSLSKFQTTLSSFLAL